MTGQRIEKGRYKTIKDQHQVNGEIRDQEVRVIGSDGNQLGIMSAREALRLAEESDLDLVKISPTANPPVCKIMDYGKYKFELGKKEKESRKNQKMVEVKEVRLSMTIDVGDLNVKSRQAQKFLEAGNKVMVSIRMRGRQNAHVPMGIEVMNRFFEMMEGKAVMDKKTDERGAQHYDDAFARKTVKRRYGVPRDAVYRMRVDRKNNFGGTKNA